MAISRCPLLAPVSDVHYPQPMFVRELRLAAGPVALGRRLAAAPGFAWLDSDGSGGVEGRFSFLAAGPVEVRRAAGDPEALSLLDELHTPEAASGRRTELVESASEVESSRPSKRSGADAISGSADAPALGTRGTPGAEVRTQTPQIALDPSSVPHWIGYIGYEACSKPRAEASPGVCFARYAAVFAFDHLESRMFLAADDAGAAARLLALADLDADGGEPEAGAARENVTSEHARVGLVDRPEPAAHAIAIAAAKELIARGELYQVNLARKLEARFEGPAIALALAMREASPVPLGLFFEDGERAVVARSMERFLRWKLPERRLHTRPIKGTRPRESGTANEPEERRALAADPKEHAEHAMIVDLMRNDLGRVAAIGSVEVVERFVVEPFARLHHLVSTIACTTRPELRASDILRATFPPGSVTGTPKLRAIQVIEALEPSPRGIYTGTVGFIDRAGGLSLAVAIRTAVVEAGVATYFAGGGIVEASDIDREIAETELKARVFTDAVENLAARAGGFEPP